MQLVLQAVELLPQPLAIARFRGGGKRAGRFLGVVPEVDEMLKPAAGFIPQRSAGRERGLLFEIGHPCRLMQLGRAGIG